MNLIVYTKSGCPWCRDALNFLREAKIIFEEREVLSNHNFFDELKMKSGQTKTPTLDLNGEILADTDVESIEKFLKLKSFI